MSALIEKIRSKGNWEITVRPEPFKESRVDYGTLEEILTGAVVRLRGWPVPYIDLREEMLRRDDWVGQDIDAAVVSHYEAWRFFVSGQFNHLRAISADWRVGQEATPVPEGSSSVIEVWEILFYLTEVFEFATRLALSPAGDKTMTVEAQINGLKGRGLVVGASGRVPFMVPYRANATSLNQKITVSRDELVGESRRLAVGMAREFFFRFGWKPSIEQLAEYQSELIDRQ